MSKKQESDEAVRKAFQTLHDPSRPVFQIGQRGAANNKSEDVIGNFAETHHHYHLQSTHELLQVGGKVIVRPAKNVARDLSWNKRRQPLRKYIRKTI